MNEQERINQFNRNLDQLLAAGELSQSASSIDDPLLALSYTLAKTDLSAESQQLHVIRQNLLKKGNESMQLRSSTMRKNRMMRQVLNVAVVLSVVIIAFLTIPPLQTFAQTLLQQIGLIQFTDAPTIPEQLAGEPAAENTAAQTYSPRLLSREDIISISGIPLYEPIYLPEGYVLVSRDVSTTENGVELRSEYTHTPQNSGDSPDFVSISQRQFAAQVQDPLQWAIGDAQPTEVIVNDQPGLYVQGAPTGRTVDDNNAYQSIGVNILVWEQDGYLFTLQSLHLDWDDMQRIASSLTP